MTATEGVPRHRLGPASVRGPPALLDPDTRKTGLPPGLPYIGAVSAEQETLRAVYRGWGRNLRRRRLAARALGSGGASSRAPDVVLAMALGQVSPTVLDLRSLR